MLKRVLKTWAILTGMVVAFLGLAISLCYAAVVILCAAYKVIGPIAVPVALIALCTLIAAISMEESK